jgi:serine/threonine-protein kinase
VGSLRPDTPADLDALLTRLLAKNPAERPATATEVRDGLTARADHLTAAARPTRPIPVVSRTRTLPVLDQGEEPPVTVRGRFRLGPAGIAAVALGAAILAALTVALLIGSQRLGADAASTATVSTPLGSASSAPGTAATDSSGGNPSGSTSTSSRPDTDTTETFTDNPDTAASARLAALIGVIEEQRQAGHLDGKAADEVTKKLQEVERELDKGDTGKAAEKLANLGSKLDEMHQDGKITTAGYEALQASLIQLADALPSAEQHEDEREG